MAESPEAIDKFTKVYKPQEIICKQGDPGDCMYIIQSGRVEVYLATAKDQGDPKPWLMYWLVLIKRLYLRFERQLQHANISPGRGAKTALVEHFVRQQTNPFRFSDVCNAFPTISHDMVRMALRRLRDQGFIRAQGRGRGALWIKH